MYDSLLNLNHRVLDCSNSERASANNEYLSQLSDEI